jgi:hypothetical protein
MYSSNIPFNYASTAADNSPESLTAEIIVGWLSLRWFKKLTSNFGISDVTTLSKNPLTPA